MIRNKVKVIFFVEDGCYQNEGEASAHWEPINFAVYSSLFPELIQDAIDGWLEDNTIIDGVAYEVIFAHTVNRDRAGAVLDELFEPIYTEHDS